MSKERDILKSLLLKEELDKLDKLEKKYLSKEQFTQEVSDVLVNAIKRSQLKDKSIERALSKPINAGITKAFSNNKQSIIDSLLPIMGQLIRKTVTNSIKQFVTDINRALELNLSFKSIKWRLQAQKAGITYAEMVFQKTISYKVQELFVINRESGLLIQHVGENATMLDNNAISGMLTVIQDFIADSVQTSDSGLSSASIGESGYIIAVGPKAYLAAIVTGATSERYKQKSQELIENIHAEFSSLLSDETRYQNDEEFEEYLSSHLISKTISPEKKKTNWIPWIVLIFLIVFGVYYWTNSVYQERKKIIDIAQSTPGFVLQDVKKDNGIYIVTGMIDPLADKSRLQTNNVELNAQPFISLDQNMIEKRVRIITNEYKNVSVLINGNNVTLSGSTHSLESDKLIKQLNNVIGIDNVINNLTIDDSKDINNFIQSHISNINEITYQYKNNLITFNGLIPKNKYLNFLHIFKKQFPRITVNDEKVVFEESINKFIQDINQTTINISKLQKGDIIEKSKLTNIIKTIKSLSPYMKSRYIHIVGESDCFGVKSDEFSQLRAEIIFDDFVNNNINKTLLKTQIKSCMKFDFPENNKKKKYLL